MLQKGIRLFGWVAFLGLSVLDGAQASIGWDRAVEVSRRLTDLYGPAVTSRGEHLVFTFLPESREISATTRHTGHLRTIFIHGGLLDLDVLTEDMFSLMTCHELGHILGGAPYFKIFQANDGSDLSQSSIEGQADYWAARECLRTLWAAEFAENAAYREVISPIAQAACDRAWDETAEQDLCYRILTTAEAMMIYDAESQLKFRPSFAHPDPAITTRLHNEFHPAPQCRLDTYVAGAVAVSESDALPGMPGARPRCWYLSDR